MKRVLFMLFAIAMSFAAAASTYAGETEKHQTFQVVDVDQDYSVSFVSLQHAQVVYAERPSDLIIAAPVCILPRPPVTIGSSKVRAGYDRRSPDRWC